MFNTIKEKVSLAEVISNDLKLDLIECGTNTYQIDRDYDSCPFCSHKDCFKIKYDPEDLPSSMYKCFSCDAAGDVINWTCEYHKLKPVEAARKLSKDYNIKLPNDYSPIQEIFEVSANYYHTTLNECKPVNKLAKMTPVEYQLKVRGHKEESLAKFQVGWSDGGLVDFLSAMGYDDDILYESGLKNKKTGKDFLPAECFIYPHRVNGRVSHFTFKDTSKKLAYQLPNKFSLNGFEFYGQDSVKQFETVIVVEGENDLISVAEVQDKYGVIATIGNLSGSQIEWIRANLSNKHVITIFDPDEAGDKYREKLSKVKSAFRSLTQIRPPNEQDIDELLVGGADLDNLIKSNQVKVEAAPNIPLPVVTPGSNAKAAGDKIVGSELTDETEEESDNSNNNGVIEKHNIYYRVKYKDGEPIYTMISNFTIVLTNVYITEDGDRLREIVIRRSDGYCSEPVVVSSEAKVSLKSFRVLLARAADADFRGTEADLISVWELVYSKNTETLVRITRIVGRHEGLKGWITRNAFISDSGEVIERDDNDIFWMKGKTVGIKAEGLNKSESNSSDIPRIDGSMTPDERTELLSGFAHNLAKNLGDVGNALLMLGWFQACAYSNSIFTKMKGFPTLFVWGTNGQGKGTICGWLMSMYDLDVTGKTTVAQIKSGVGLSRKAEYYSSLPLLIDEIRSDQETQSHLATFRTYYDREARTMGDKNGFGVRVIPVRSCIMFAGEDMFEDPATKERCVIARVPKLGREMVESFKWMEDNRGQFSNIGFKWLLESVNSDHAKILEAIVKLDKELILEAKCTSRKSKLWSTVGYFSIKLAEEFFPEFDMRKYLYKVSTEDAVVQKGETTVSQFFETVESIMSQEGVPKITISHIVREDNMLHIWFPHVYRVVSETAHGRLPFTKNAIISALKEEPYYVSDNRKISMGGDGTRRVVITLDLNKAPDSVKNIGQNNHVST